MLVLLSIQLSFILWAICAGLGWMIGNSKDRGLAGFWYGLALGIIGLICALYLTPESEREREAEALRAYYRSQNPPESVIKEDKKRPSMTSVWNGPAS